MSLVKWLKMGHFQSDGSDGSDRSDRSDHVTGTWVWDYGTLPTGFCGVLGSVMESCFPSAYNLKPRVKISKIIGVYSWFPKNAMTFVGAMASAAFLGYLPRSKRKANFAGSSTSMIFCWVVW